MEEEDTQPTLAEELGAGATMRAARDLVESYVKPQIITLVEPVTGVHALAQVDRSGARGIPASLFDDYRKEPVRRRGVATLFDLASFIEQSKRFLTTGSLVFADNNRDHPSLTTVFDYHPAGYDSPARFGGHRASFAFPLSDEWKAWHELDGKAMEMATFA